MEIDIEIKDLFKIGTFTPLNIVITLQSVAEKRLIYKNIKEFVNRDGRKIIFRDYLLPQENERRK